MSATPYDAFIRHVTQTVELDQDEIDLIRSMLIYKEVKKKDFLLREGEICRHKNYVLKGCLMSYYIANNGQERVMYFAVEDYWANDLVSYFTETPASFFMQALEDTALLQISRPDLETIFNRIPRFERFFRIKYQNSLIAQDRRTMHNLFERAEQQYMEFRRKYPDLEQRIPLKYIASYLGITQQFLSVLRSRAVHRPPSTDNRRYT